MKKIFNLCLLALLVILLQSQYIGPDGNSYSNACLASDPSHTFEEVLAWYDDPDGDCQSNNWIVQFTYHDGTIGYMNNAEWANNHPETGGWYNFDNNNYNCCTEEHGGGGGGSSSTLCDWEMTPGSVLVITCP